ncbi:MAG: type II toxin-antitoxin system RelE/ParE family toxin [Verrucomicrobiaceae bacterium]|nr:type II toxin-antitoxin system RelE/ParE family toxin [Verrucomicrobiaceae bacterium]
MKLATMHPTAERELGEITDYYAAIAAELADAFVGCFESYKARIVENPLQFSIRRGAVRRANLAPQFGEYYLPFMIQKNRVVILAVAHARRRPHYWRDRIGEAKKLA